eukprot:scaffold2088_cov399-Prasinococcus_capsulatus_cf.AAC.9
MLRPMLQRLGGWSRLYGRGPPLPSLLTREGRFFSVGAWATVNPCATKLNVDNPAQLYNLVNVSGLAIPVYLFVCDRLGLTCWATYRCRVNGPLAVS